MTRVLRTSFYGTDALPPLIGVVTEHDVVDTLESCALALQTPGALLIWEIFETRAKSSVEFSLEALKRIDKLAEQNMATLFFYYGGHLRRVKEGGILAPTKNSPLTRDQIVHVYEQLADHPDYKQQTILGLTSEGEEVCLVKGKIQEDH